MEKRLLVIDDDQDIRDLVREIFEEDDYTVHCLADVDDIFSEISHFRPDVVLIDYKLGISNGADICYQIKSNAGTLHIPVVLFSAHHREIDSIGNYGWNAFIGKPFDISHIRQVIGKYLIRKTGEA
ncbi:MAG TPA: response regulator [Mucilaginibacter sp.]|jgi:DNA-binding response OmpR family regulator|nr:response regulator [Mucilaginibacter sp.]